MFGHWNSNHICTAGHNLAPKFVTSYTHNCGTSRPYFPNDLMQMALAWVAHLLAEYYWTLLWMAKQQIFLPDTSCYDVCIYVDTWCVNWDKTITINTNLYVALEKNIICPSIARNWLTMCKWCRQGIESRSEFCKNMFSGLPRNCRYKIPWLLWETVYSQTLSHVLFSFKKSFTASQFPNDFPLKIYLRYG